MTDAVNNTADQTTDTVGDVTQQTTQTVDDTVKTVAGAGPVADTVDHATDTVDQTVEPTATDTVDDAVGDVTSGLGGRLTRLHSPGPGAWRSLVARTVRVGEVPGSNPGAPMEQQHRPTSLAAPALYERQRSSATLMT